MLTQLSTVKARLGVPELDTTNDTLLTRAIEAISARFDRECNRVLDRTADAVHEFGADRASVCPACYPVETVTRFELKRNEADGWVEQAGVEYLVRQACVISLARPLGNGREQARVIYTGGYVPPGTMAEPGQAPLPADLENAAIEQVVYWFTNRDRQGLERIWEYHSTYRQFADLDLLTGVKAVLKKYIRCAV